MVQDNQKGSSGLIFVAAVAVIVVLVIVAMLAVRPPPSSGIKLTEIPFACPSLTKEVAPNICDDGVDTAYFSIKRDNDEYVPYDHVLPLIILRKKTWEAKFPTKHIVAMIRIEESNGGNTTLVGILIHYESNDPTKGERLDR